MLCDGNKIGHGDILHCEDTGEHFVLIERKEREYGDSQMEPAWDILDLLTGKTFWEWEFVLEDDIIYKRVA